MEKGRKVYQQKGVQFLFAEINLNGLMNHFILSPYNQPIKAMIPENSEPINKKASFSRRRALDPTQFDCQITVQFDEFFRFFNYYYPGKNKEDIVNKCITGNTYWITIDALYYPETVDLEIERIAVFRKKAVLKNGSFPPTKDSLEEEKFILLVRRLIADHIHTLNLDLIRETSIQLVIDCLEASLRAHQRDISQQLNRLTALLVQDTTQGTAQLRSLGVPFAQASRLFAYEHLEKEVINSSIEKAEMKEKEPRCDFCFLREKDVVKCSKCELYTHPTCFARAPKDHRTPDFICDGCKHGIPPNAQCQLCPVQNGHFLELANQSFLQTYKCVRGETNLKLRVTRQRSTQRVRQFVHVSCYVLRPQCTYNLVTERVEGFHLIDRNKKNANLCAVCGNMVGITVSCNNESCRRSYHPQCAKRNGLSINVIRANNKALLEIYCERHKKPESFEYLRDSVSNRVKELRKFYESLDYELKKNGINHGPSKIKKQSKTEELLKQDRCLQCGEQNNFEKTIVNCRRCYGWHHEICSPYCPYCDA